MIASMKWALVLAGTLGATAAQAVLVDFEPIPTGWGVHTSTMTAGNCPSFCAGGAFAFDENGGEFVSSAASAQNTHGTATASATFAAGSAWLPELHAYGQSGLGKGASATAFASQRFVYSGAGEDVTLAVQLHGLVSNGASGYASNTVSAAVALMRGDGLGWYPSFGTLVYEVGSGFFPTVAEPLFIDSANVSTVNTTMAFQLTRGDVFYIVSELQADAKNGTADASGTLTMALTNTMTGQSVQNLVPTSAVPEASSWAMLTLGLVALGALRRRSAR